MADCAGLENRYPEGFLGSNPSPTVLFWVGRPSTDVSESVTREARYSGAGAVSTCSRSHEVASATVTLSVPVTFNRFGVSGSAG